VKAVQAISTSLPQGSTDGIAGTFMLRYGGGQTDLNEGGVRRNKPENTLAIPFNATSAVIIAELEKLPSIPTGSIDVNAGAGRGLTPASKGWTWDVTFSGFVGSQPLLDFDDTLLQGNGAKVTTSHVTVGTAPNPIKGSPFTIEVVPDVAHPSTTTALGEGLVAATAGVEALFKIQAM
jgi:hypothetical protein